MNALYNHPKVKAMVNFTHGEGFGAPILEFSMSGKPILASNWSGHLDFLNPKLCKLLEGEVAPLTIARSEEHGDTWEIERMIPMGKGFGTRPFVLITPVDKPREIVEGEIMCSIG